MLWAGEQLAISEVMTVRDPGEGGRAHCMGFATFCRKWKADEDFRDWLHPIVEDLFILGETNDPNELERLQFLQHLLSELLVVLSDQGQGTNMRIIRCNATPTWCRCNYCDKTRSMTVSRPSILQNSRQNAATLPIFRPSNGYGKDESINMVIGAMGPLTQVSCSPLPFPTR
uniref:Uncharacterized protein n=1 Tax=Moniliophthora roreri TaxID=221103 RepID=A0A0W0FEC1_MONRR